MKKKEKLKIKQKKMKMKILNYVYRKTTTREI